MKSNLKNRNCQMAENVPKFAENRYHWRTMFESEIDVMLREQMLRDANIKKSECNKKIERCVSVCVCVC